MMIKTFTTVLNSCKNVANWKQFATFSLLVFAMAFSTSLKANITSANASGSYVDNMDGTYTVTIDVTFGSSTVEWLDWVQFTLPAGFTYVGNEGGDAAGTGQGHHPVSG